MSYVSISFAVLVAAALILYYIVPVKARWFVLLISSLAFYGFAGKWAILIVIFTATVAFFLGRSMGDKISHNKYIKSHDYYRDGDVECIPDLPAPVKAPKALFIFSIILILLPWIGVKLSGISVLSSILGKEIAIIGISFYTLELISYLTDVYKGELEAEKNYLHFMTYALFFPKIMQGPICQYKELAPKLFKEHSFDAKLFTYGFMEILWGAFLKFVVADKCSVIVNPVFDNFIVYDGLYLWLALALFLVVLYTDFLACVMITKGVSSMFGIDLFMNFRRPLLATNFKDFWQRWHISLSNWLSRYIYIPLGGSRKGEKRRLINLLITFGVSAVWHGTCTGFLMWGLLQALFRMSEEVVGKLKHRVWLGRLKICALYGFSLIFFKLPTAKEGFSYIKYMFNFTGLINLRATGLIRESMGYKEFAILIGAILLLTIKELMNESKVNFKERLYRLPFPARLAFYVVFILFIVSFGTYGYGFNAADFIYGGF